MISSSVIEDFIDEIWELEKVNRKKATEKLLKKISENSDLLSKFIVALSGQGKVYMNGWLIIILIAIAPLFK